MEENKWLIEANCALLLEMLIAIKLGSLYVSLIHNSLARSHFQRAQYLKAFIK